jgi:hypothetical protein
MKILLGINQRLGATIIARKLFCNQAGHSMRKSPEPQRMEQERRKRLSSIAFFMAGKE